MKLTIPPEFFNETYLKYALKNQARDQIYYGGSSSGKSYAIVGQRTVLDVMKGQRNYLICRNTANTIEGSVWNEVLNAINSMELAPYFYINKSSKVITNRLNKKQIIFKGLDDVQKIKSIRPLEGPITDIVVEEGTEVSDPRTLKDLHKRQRGQSQVKKRFSIIFNPIYKTHHIYKNNFMGRWDDNGPQYQEWPGLTILKATYKDNIRFLTPEDVYDLENESDPYYYNVYTLGNWGVLGNLLFKNWTVKDITDEERKTFDCIRHGVDWGFSPDPYAYIKLHYDRKRRKIYVLDEVYENGLLNRQSAEKIRPYAGSGRIACDSAEPKSIAEYRINYGLNAYAVKKGPGSVLEGVKFLQDHEIIVNRSCQNIQNELSLYKRKENRDGEVLPEPLDKNNHLIDAMRYALEQDMIESAGPVTVPM